MFFLESESVANDLPCPKVSSSLILLLGMIIFPVSSLICLDVTGVIGRSPILPGTTSAEARNG